MHEEHFTSKLTALPADTPAVNRIKALLKLAGRSFKLRCDGIEQLDGLSGEPSDIEIGKSEEK